MASEKNSSSSQESSTSTTTPTLPTATGALRTDSQASHTEPASNIKSPTSPTKEEFLTPNEKPNPYNIAIPPIPDDDVQRSASQTTSMDKTRKSTTIAPNSNVSANIMKLAEPPPLNYTLEGRKKWIFIFWSLILFDSIVIPVGLYFGLWYGTNLSHNAVFSISTGALGGVSILEYFLRFYRLFKKGSTCRVIGARRWYLDWFHWNFSIAWIFIMVELIIGTIPDEPPIRLLAMPVSSLCYWFAFQLLAQDVLRTFGYRTPIRISSVSEGSPFRPGIYSIIEDVCAVDGSGGTEFRVALDVRYRASHYFRQMLHRLTAYWGLGAMGVAILTTVLVFTLERDAAYVVGWVVPFIWAGIWSWGTIYYVKRCLRRERAKWGRPVHVV